MAEPNISNPELIIKFKFCLFIIIIPLYPIIGILDKASNAQTSTHFKQPVQLLPLTIRACLCQGKFTLPNTFSGHFSRHFQHALHFPESNST